MNVARPQDLSPPAVREDVRVGLCGFTVAMKDYAARFPVVEIQHTFYEPPGDELMLKWRRAMPSVEFTMKVWQLVTHARSSPTYRRLKRPLNDGDDPGFFRDSPAVAEGWRRSVHCAETLSATGMLFQSPASFTPDAENVARMRRFFERLDRPQARLLWEPRGPQWVAHRELALALCRDLQLVHVVDPFVTPPASRGEVYWRLHGIGGARHSYTDAQLRQLHSLLVQQAHDAPAYVLFNNLPRAGDASRFVRMLGE
jgi:uncharacterized protein YecE (DUF72 family)